METAIQPRAIKTFIGGPYKMKFGDFFLFQEYSQGQHDGTQYSYDVSRPVLAVFVGVDACDQTLEFAYVIVQNVNRVFAIPQVQTHIEWGDYADILGHWESRPNWKQILAAYRTQNTAYGVLSEEIDWHFYD